MDKWTNGPIFLETTCLRVPFWTPNKTYVSENCCQRSRIWSKNCCRRKTFNLKTAVGKTDLIWKLLSAVRGLPTAVFRSEIYSIGIGVQIEIGAEGSLDKSAYDLSPIRLSLLAFYLQCGCDWGWDGIISCCYQLNIVLVWKLLSQSPDRRQQFSVQICSADSSFQIKSVALTAVFRPNSGPPKAVFKRIGHILLKILTLWPIFS